MTNLTQSVKNFLSNYKDDYNQLYSYILALRNDVTKAQYTKDPEVFDSIKKIVDYWEDFTRDGKAAFDELTILLDNQNREILNLRSQLAMAQAALQRSARGNDEDKPGTIYASQTQQAPIGRSSSEIRMLSPNVISI